MNDQPALFPGLEASTPLPFGLNAMHKAHGSKPGYICGDCRYCGADPVASRNRRWYKCSKARVSASAATDWRKKWPACGLYRAEPL